VSLSFRGFGPPPPLLLVQTKWIRGEGRLPIRPLGSPLEADFAKAHGREGFTLTKANLYHLDFRRQFHPSMPESLSHCCRA